jgi:hypothetical protein
MLSVVAAAAAGGSSVLAVTGRCSTVSTAVRNDDSARLLHTAEYHTWFKVV